MPSEPEFLVSVRPFHRNDRDQVTNLITAHAAAVVPNAVVPVQTVLAQLEREPGEFLVDPWVAERVTLVAEQRSFVVAAAHLLRYRDDESVGAPLRGAGEIRWLVAWPPSSPYSPTDDSPAGPLLLAACLARFDRWHVTERGADGALPTPGVYGIPEQWPHIRKLLDDAGFRGGRLEVVQLAAVGDLPRTAPPLPGLTVRRTLGAVGTRFTAVLDDDAIGLIEIDTALEPAQRLSRADGPADIGNLWVAPSHRRAGVATWLVGQAARWLDLGGVTRLLAYCEETEPELAAFLAAAGFHELTRTTRGLRIPYSAGGV